MQQPEASTEHAYDGLEGVDPNPALTALQSLRAGDTAQLMAKLDLYDSVFEQFPGGICVFDNDMQMTLCNEQLKELLNYPAELFADGLPTIEQLFRFNASRGEYGAGDVEEHVQSRLRLVRQGRSHRYDRQSADGTILEVRGRPLDGGGFVTTYTDVTKQRNQAKKIEALVDEFPGGICIFDEQFNMILCNETLRERLPDTQGLFKRGLPAMNDYVLHNARHGVYGNGNPAQIAAARLTRIRRGRELREQCEQRNGNYLEVSVLPLREGGYVEMQIDITEERIRTLQLESVVENFPGGLSMYDKNLKLVLHNEQFRDLLGYPSSLLEKTNLGFQDLVRFDAGRGKYGDGDVEGIVSEQISLAKLGQPRKAERKHSDGTALEICGVPLEGGGILSTCVDITERLEQQALALKMANFSPVAGLPNRSLFLDRLDIALAQAERGGKMAVLYIDIHQRDLPEAESNEQISDRILSALGDRFNKTKRATDTYAHLGAHQFGIVQVGIVGIEGAEILARRILRTVREPVNIGDQVVELDACIGIALAPEDGTGSDEIQEKAESALEKANTDEPGTIVFFPDFSAHTRP